MNIVGKLFGAGRLNRAASRDFRPEDLPDTRVKLFFDALKIRWSAMVGLNLLTSRSGCPESWRGQLSDARAALASAPSTPADAARPGERALFTFLLVLWPLVR